MASQSDLAQLRQSLLHDRISNCSNIFKSTVFIYDYLLTFNSEKILIWPSSWSITKTLFLVTRYAPFIDITIILWQLIKPEMTPKDCAFVYKSTGWLTVFGILVVESKHRPLYRLRPHAYYCEVLHVIRTWAVYAQRRSVAIGLVIWILLIWVPIIAIFGVFIPSLQECGSFPVKIPSPGCYVVAGSSIGFICWTLLMMLEAGMLGLMVNKAVNNYRTHQSSALFRAVFRDGSIFYVYLSTLSTANSIVIFTSSPDLIHLLSEYGIHSSRNGLNVVTCVNWVSIVHLDWTLPLLALKPALTWSLPATQFH